MKIVQLYTLPEYIQGIKSGFSTLSNLDLGDVIVTCINIGCAIYRIGYKMKFPSEHFTVVCWCALTIVNLFCCVMCVC